MSLFSTMKTGASGLGVASMSLSVIGDNIANVNTTGFKASRATFADFLPSEGMSMTGSVAIGSGAGTQDVACLFGQGTLNTTGNAMDLAISGGGFFMVKDGNVPYYTRAGNFGFDESGYVVTSSGMKLQGYSVDENADVGSTLSDLRVDVSSIPPQATETVSMTALLSAEAEYDDTPITSGTLPMDGNTTAISDLASAADYTTSVTTYDALGRAHEVTIAFERTGVNTWSWNAVVDGGEVGRTDGDAFRISGGTMTFDGDGNLTACTQTNTSATTAWSYDGATPTDIEFDFGQGDDAEGDVRMQGDTSTLTTVAQDGYPLGDLLEVSVDADGVVQGAYSNGEQRTLGQVALATFSSPAGLEREGSNLFRATRDSGEPTVGVPGTSGRGDLASCALEGSNVDLEAELISMIQAQRTYQANARVVSSAADTLSELVNIV